MVFLSGWDVTIPAPKSHKKVANLNKKNYSYFILYININMTIMNNILKTNFKPN